MATKWEDVVTDKSNYPDDTVLKLADGSEVRLGDVRPGFMKDADYRQKTSLLARQREEFESQAVQRMQALQEGESQLRQIAAELVRQNPGMTRREAIEEVATSTDPEVQKLRNELAELKNVVVPMNKNLQDWQANAAAQRQNYVINEHRKALLEIKADHPDTDEAALIQYAKDNFVPNLKKAWTLMNHDRIIADKVKEAREVAYKEGMDKAKMEGASSPILPMRTVTAVRPEGAPKNMKEAMSQALRDPEVMGPLTTGRIS